MLYLAATVEEIKLLSSVPALLRVCGNYGLCFSKVGYQLFDNETDVTMFDWQFQSMNENEWNDSLCRLDVICSDADDASLNMSYSWINGCHGIIIQ